MLGQAKPLSATDVEVLNSVARQAPVTLRLQRSGSRPCEREHRPSPRRDRCGRFRPSRRPRADPGTRVLNEECTRLYLDTSRGHNRRWCGMTECGNRKRGPSVSAIPRGRHAGMMGAAPAGLPGSADPIRLVLGSPDNRVRGGSPSACVRCAVNDVGVRLARPGEDRRGAVVVRCRSPPEPLFR